MEEQYLGKEEEARDTIWGFFFSCRKQEKPYKQSIFTLQSIVDTEMTHSTQDV